ncbi:MAG TPA: TIGR03067 domain-containing protein [Terracidiphilus sp.]
MKLLSILAVSLLLTACKSGGDPAADLNAWQGTWTLVSVMNEGQSQTHDMQWVVEGDQYRIKVEGQLQPDPYGITLDPSRGHIDVFHHDTPAGTYGGKLKGIYKMSGDTLTVCYDLTGSTYPDSFDAPAGSRRAVYVFKK